MALIVSADLRHNRPSRYEGPFLTLARRRLKARPRVRLTRLREPLRFVTVFGTAACSSFNSTRDYSRMGIYRPV